MIQILESLTKLEVMLIFIVLLMTVVVYFKLESIHLLRMYNADLRINNHNLYAMYMQLSNSSLEIVHKWQKSIDENKTLFEKLNHSSQSNL